MSDIEIPDFLLNLPMEEESKEAAATARKPKCPICGRETVVEFKPFCSKRCRDVDLHAWMTDAYAFAADESQPSSGQDSYED